MSIEYWNDDHISDLMHLYQRHQAPFRQQSVKYKSK